LHEYVYADRILQSVLELLPHGKKSPRAVQVEVGEMLGLTSESLQMAYGILSKGTKAEGSRLKVDITEGSVECPVCGFSGRLPHRRHEHLIDPAFACPECGSSLRVNGGLEVKLLGVEW
jgi:hydrogenase nickel incorporation protein HypA/HybF